MRKLTNILLNFGNYVPYNVELAKILGGAENAIMLSVLINRYNYYFNEGKLDSEGFFYCTSENLESISAIGGRAQNTAIKALVSHKLIIKKVKGLPATTHYKLHENAETSIEDLLNKFAQNEETCKSEKNKLDGAKCGTSYNINNNKEIDINNRGEETPTPQIENVNFDSYPKEDFEKNKLENLENANEWGDPPRVKEVLPLEEKKEKEKKVAAKKEKEINPVLKTMAEAYPNEADFVTAWGLRFGAKYPNVDASKGYNRILLYCESSGKKYADYVRVLLVWYTGEAEAKKQQYHYDKATKQSENYLDKLFYDIQNADPNIV